MHDLRGVRSGALRDLTPLVVLVGPNGSGKSTVLDAMLIGAGYDPVRSVRYVVQRRPLAYGARWLLRGGPTSNTRARVRIELADECAYACELEWLPDEYFSAKHPELARRWGDLVGAVQVELVDYDGRTDALHIFRDKASSAAPRGVVGFDREGGAKIETHLYVNGPRAWMVDPRAGKSLHELYSRLAERGRREMVLTLVRAVVDDLQVIEMLTDRNDPRLHLTFSDHSVPVALAGDGVQVLVRLCLEFALCSGGTLLLEEPEAHQHPAVIRQSARAIVAGVRAGVQAVIATHSLELIDGLLAELEDSELDRLSLYRLRLERGELRSSRLAGSEVWAGRRDIEEDLR